MSESRASELLSILDLETIDTNLFRGTNEKRFGARLFGGQVLAQALTAAGNTVAAERQCHSLHAYFLRPGDASVPVVYSVDRIRDGGSFTTRRIVAIQHGEAIFSMDASFQVAESGLSHQIEMATYPDPDDLEDDMDVARRFPDVQPASGWSTRERPFDLRSVYPADAPSQESNQNPVWIRFREAVPESPRLSRCLLAYASDMGLVSTAMLPHRRTVRRDRVQMASLDHGLWFHRDADLTDWLLFAKETTNADSARGFNRAAFYSRDGKLIASAMQEGLMRERD